MKCTASKEKLLKAVPKAPEQVTEIMSRVYEATESQPKDSSRTVVLIRAIKAVLQVFESIDSGKVASASSDFELLLAFLEEPTVIGVLSKKDPLAAAKLRGFKAQIQILYAEGGCVSAEEAGELIGIKKAAIHKARSEGRILGLPRGQNQFVFPVWQFHDGQILSGLKAVYLALECSPWMKASFMLSSNSRLKDETPLALVRRGEIDKVIEAAQLLGEHGAV